MSRTVVSDAPAASACVACVCRIQCGLEALDEDEQTNVQDGGAAMTAYARLQFEDLSIEHRKRIEDALYRYCELDTLAVAMVVQAWQAEI